VDAAVTDPIAGVAQQISSPENDQNLDYAQLRQGVVIAISAPDNSCTMYLSGDTTTQVPGIKCLNSFQPVVGDTLWVVKNKSDMIGIGKVGSGTNTAFAQIQGNPNAVMLLTTGGFTTVAGSTSPTLTKRFSTSNLAVSATCTGWANATGAQLQLGVKIDATVYTVGTYPFDIQTIGGGGSGTTNFTQRGVATGSIVVPSLAVGAHSVTLQVTNGSGTGIIQVNQGDWYSMTITEQL
jgi:hypothetical protein